MKSMIAAAVLACAALACADANATTFEFSYTFDNGGAITGSLDGSLVGSFIQNVSNVQVAFAGFAYDQPLYTAAYLPDGSLSLGNPIVSVDGDQNDFAFGNAPSTDASEYFVFVGSTAGGGVSQVLAQGPLGGGEDVPMNSSWSIRPVPLPAAGWLLSSGIGLLGVWRCRTSAG